MTEGFKPIMLLKSGLLCTVSCLCLLPFVAQAQIPDAGTLSREIGRDLPRLQKEDTLRAQPDGQQEAQQLMTAPAPSAPPAKGPIPIWESEREAPEDQIMAAPFRKIYIRAPRFHEEIQKIVRDEIIERNQLREGGLGRIRSRVWNLYLQHSRLAHIAFKIIPVAGHPDESVMRVQIEEVRRNKIIIQDQTAKGLDDATRSQILSQIEASFTEGTLLNLEELDARIKHRMRLGDYDMQIALAPVDQALMDIKVAVKQKQTQPTSYLFQYDNNGTRAFGRDRLVAAASFNQVARAGDRLDATLMKSLDFATPTASGIVYGRGEYETPLSAFGVRASAWGSAMHYDAVSRTSTNDEASGQAYEIGVGVSKPLYTGKASILDGRIDFIEKFVRDRFDDNTVTSDKISHSGRIKMTGATMPTPSHIVRYGVTPTVGAVDLSGEPSALAQDRAGPKANGIFAKAEADASWQYFYSPDNRGDFKLATRGQASAGNLDSMEKFNLGGVSGLRAFGSGEASGDMGAIVNAELGYQFTDWLRAMVFYDAGVIWRNFDPYETNATAPNNYMLQDAGLGVTVSYKQINASLMFAHQVGPNPGLSATGRDADNATRNFRILTTLSYVY